MVMAKIDHIRVFSSRVVNREEMKAFETLRKLWIGREDLGELVFLSAVPASNFPSATEVVCSTPVIFGRHYKPGKGDFTKWLEPKSCVLVLSLASCSNRNQT